MGNKKFDPQKPITQENLPTLEQLQQHTTDEWPMQEHLAAIQKEWVQEAENLSVSVIDALFRAAVYMVEGSSNWKAKYGGRQAQLYEYRHLSLLLDKQYSFTVNQINITGEFQSLSVYLNADPGDPHSGKQVARLIRGYANDMIFDTRTRVYSIGKLIDDDEKQPVFLTSHKEKTSYILPGSWYTTALEIGELAEEVKQTQETTIAIAERNQTLRRWGLV